jgi:hypothetical protein
MLTLRVVTVTLCLVVGTAIGVAGQDEEAGPSAPASSSAEASPPAQTWLDEQTCIDPNFMMPQSSHGTSVGDLFHCARSLGLRKRDADYDAYDFSLGSRNESWDRYTTQCDDAGNHVGSRYHAWGTDRIYNEDKPKRAVEGTFDFSVVSMLLDPDEDIWLVEQHGVIWDLHSPDEDWGWTWSVDITLRSEGVPEDPSNPSVADGQRGVERSAFQALCDYLK